MEPLISIVQLILTVLLPKLWFLFFVMRFLLPSSLKLSINIIIGVLTALLGILITKYHEPLPKYR